MRLLSGSSSGGDISQAVATSSNASSMSINSDTTPFALKSSAESEAAAAAAAAEAAAAEAARAQALQAHQQFAEELYQRAQILRQHLRTQADEVRTRLRQVNLTVRVISRLCRWTFKRALPAKLMLFDLHLLLSFLSHVG